MQVFVFAVVVALGGMAVVKAHELVWMDMPALNSPREISAEEAKSVQPKADKKFKKITQPKGAGKWSSVINSQIVGGSPAAKGQMPWQVLVLRDDKFMCGGSLIAAQFVLTAAHCAFNGTNFVLTFGAIRPYDFENGRVQVETTLKYVHPNYNRVGITNDIAILKLPISIFNTYSTNIWFVRLPDTTVELSKTFEGVVATVAGWGRRNGSDFTSTSRFLNYVNMPVISNTDCAKRFSNIQSTSLCADTSNGKKTSCQGDSGGALVYLNPNTKLWTQIGIVSYGGDPCDSGRPTVFARVTAYLSWISSTIAAARAAG